MKSAGLVLALATLPMAACVTYEHRYVQAQPEPRERADEPENSLALGLETGAQAIEAPADNPAPRHTEYQNSSDIAGCVSTSAGKAVGNIGSQVNHMAHRQMPNITRDVSNALLRAFR